MDELRLDPERATREGRGPAPARRGLRPMFWIGLILVVLAALAWWVHTRPAPKAPGGRFANAGPMPVVIGTAAPGDIAITYNALGTVTPLATVTVQAQVAGQLTAVAFKEGQEVQKGDLLAQIDPRSFQAALDQATSQLARDQASLDMARTDFVRYQKLAEQNSIARQQAEDQQFVVRQDEGTVKLDQALVDTARINLGYTRITAPLPGRIGLRQVDPGNYIQVAGATPVAVITQMKPISVIFTLPEDELPAVMKRLSGGATLPVTAYDRSNTTKLADGALGAVDSSIDQTTGTVRLRAEFPNGDEALFPNQFVNARLLIDTLKGAVVIPTAAVQRGQPGTFVYVVKPDDTVTVKKVKLGPQQGERVAVTDGLANGDKVVVDGADKLREGAKISLRQESGAADASTPAPPPADPQQQRGRRRTGQDKSGGPGGNTGGGNGGGNGGGSSGGGSNGGG
jgi:membrane fusion protein, multidrug efflux system